MWQCIDVSPHLTHPSVEQVLESVRRFSTCQGSSCIVDVDDAMYYPAAPGASDAVLCACLAAAAVVAVAGALWHRPAKSRIAA